VSLTPAGVILSRYAETVLAVLEEAEAALASTRDQLTGPLRIGAFPTAARTLLPPALVTLGRDHPGLELMVTELDPAAVPGALRGGALDVALTTEYDHVVPEPDPAIAAEPLLEEAVYLAAPAPARGEPARTAVAACRDEPWIAGSPDSMCHAMTIRACQAAGFTPRIRHVADDFATVLVLVAAGQGVSLIPELGLAGPPGGVTLTPLPARRRVSVAYRNGTGAHPAVAAFTAAIRASPPLACVRDLRCHSDVNREHKRGDEGNRVQSACSRCSAFPGKSSTCLTLLVTPARPRPPWRPRPASPPPDAAAAAAIRCPACPRSR
jgi:DNA-binding transcriptional LysR family regulator